jgi:hypothetical protein
MQNLIPTNIISSEYIVNLQNLAAQQPGVVQMRKLYEIAAPYIESRVVFNGAHWDIRLSLSRKNYLHIVEQYAKLDFSKGQFKAGGHVGWNTIITIPPIMGCESVVPRELAEKYKAENIKNINEYIDQLVITQNDTKTIIYTGE